MDSKYWPKEAILAFEKIYRYEDNRFLDKQCEGWGGEDCIQRVAILERLRDSGLNLKDVIEKADDAFEKAYSEGDYELGSQQFQKNYDNKITLTALRSDKDAKNGVWRPPFSTEFAMKQVECQIFQDKNKSNTTTFWFSKGERGRRQPFRSKEEVKESFWRSFFESLLLAADKHNQRQGKNTTKALNEYEKQINDAIKCVDNLISVIKKAEEHREAAAMPSHKFEYFPLSWFMKGFEIQDRLRQEFNLSISNFPEYWDDTASCPNPREEMLALNRFAGPKYWASGTSVLTGLKETLEESQTKIKEKKKQRQSSKKARGFFNALITEHGWDRDASESLRLLPANFIKKFNQDPDLIIIATTVLMDDGGKKKSLGKQTINDAIKPILENWRGQLKNPVFFEKIKK